MQQSSSISFLAFQSHGRMPANLQKTLKSVSRHFLQDNDQLRQSLSLELRGRWSLHSIENRDTESDCTTKKKKKNHDNYLSSINSKNLQ